MWPVLSFGVSNENFQTSGGELLVSNRNGHYVAYGDTRETAVWTRVYVPLLFHPVPHFFLGFGPSFLTDLFHEASEEKNRRISFGATTTLGGWF